MTETEELETDEPESEPTTEQQDEEAESNESGSSSSLSDEKDDEESEEEEKEQSATQTKRIGRRRFSKKSERGTFYKAGDALNKVSKWKSTAKKKLANRLEDQMNFEHLKKLEEIFQEADADGGGGLDIDEFREAMKRTMGSEVDDKELEIIFMKVDTNCDGTVDWDEYLSYMLLEYQEKDTMTSLIKEIPFPKKLREMQSFHRDCVVRIAFLQQLTNRHGNKALNRDNPGGKFVCLSKEGQLGVYGADFEFQKSLPIDPGRESYVGQWMTDMVPLANVTMLATSSTERDITFYDANGNKFDKQFQITGFTDPILAMDFWFDHENLNHCTLIAGDATGNIIVLKFVEALHRGLFAVFPQKGVVTRIGFLEIIKGRVKGAFGMIFQGIHSNWVNHVRYFQLAQGSECFISCSSTEEDSMHLGDLTNIILKPKWPGYSKALSNKSSYFKVRRGVLTFDYCKDWNVIVTGSTDGIVRTWNPYSPKPAALVKGHMSPVQHVSIISSSGQVITLARDRVIRIIELRDLLTTQVLSPRSFLKCGPLTHSLQAMFYHERTKSLWVAAIQVGMLEGYDDRVKEDQMNIKSHDGAVTAVLYNHLFNQVVTGGHDSIVSVWDLNTGVKAIQFYTVKGVELTYMTFDPTGRRLITGSRNGAIKIWNFNNGACLRTLREENMLEVTGIICLRQRIISVGWDKVPTVYIDSRDDEDDSYTLLEVHKDDILCLAKFHSAGGSIMASASYDGDIFIWSVDTGHVLCRLNRQESYSPLSIQGHSMRTPNKAARTDITLQKTNSQQSSASSESVSQSTRHSRHSTVGSNAKLPEINISGGIINANVDPISNDEESPPPTIKKQSLLSTSRTSTPKSVKFSLPDVMMPSAAAMRSITSKEDKVRHHVDIVTGQESRDYWEADVSIDKLIFLQSRPHEPQTATLFAAGALGWVYAWSVHPQGGLLGQFVGAQRDGDTVVSLATDKNNRLLITGDTSGYVKMWNIENYCCRKRKFSRKSIVRSLNAPAFDMTTDQMRILSVRRMMKLKIVPPDVVTYFRAHIGSVTDITYIDDKNLLLTACGDGTVRLWMISGQYIGTFGQKQAWQIDEKTGGKIPADVKRVASANTLKVMHSGQSSWRLARNVLNFVGIGAKMHSADHARADNDPEEHEDDYQIYNKLVGEEEVLTDADIERNYQKCVEKLGKSDVLGKSYTQRRRHRILPKIEVKTHLNNFHVHSSIPFSPLEKTELIIAPELLQEKWRMQREMFQITEGERSKPSKGPMGVKRTQSRRTPSSKKGRARSKVTFARSSNKTAKSTKTFRPPR